MKKVMTLLGLFLGGLLVLLVVVVAGLMFAGSSRLGRSLDVEAEPVAVPADDAALARGEHLVNVFCRDCHAADLGGRLFMDEPPLATVYSPNLTGLAASHGDEELVLALRHGLDGEKRPLLIMPAESFVHFSEEDLGAIIAYLRTVPRRGEAQPERVIHPVGRIMAGAGLLDSTIPATYIDHDAPFHPMPQVGANAAYGEYLARFCEGCHGAELTGGQPPDPASPPAPNLTPAGALGSWSEEGFIRTMRTGVTPNGRELDAESMPWKSIGKLEDEELNALWIYLSALPAQTAATE